MKGGVGRRRVKRQQHMTQTLRQGPSRASYVTEFVRRSRRKEHMVACNIECPFLGRPPR